ncbi:MAG TPA: hypothetical protein VF390_02230 [Patescibacteria group bacterium]
MKRKNLSGSRHSSSADVLVRCAVCNSGFDKSGLVTLEEQNQKTTLHVTCAKCGTASIIFLSISQSGVAGLGVATDLNTEEAIRMFGREAVSADEVIDMHQLMSKYKGSITDLVKKIN